MDSPIVILKRIQEDTQSGRALRDAPWLHINLLEYLNPNNEKSLDEICGLSAIGPGKLKPATKARLGARNLTIKKYAEKYYSNLPCGQAAYQIRKDFDKYERRKWKEDQFLDVPPENYLDKKEYYLFLARKGNKIPQIRQLETIISNN